MKVSSISAIFKIIMVGLCISLLNLNSQQVFDIMPTNIHFFGTVATSKNIIAYGNLGSYLITTDGGKSWKQINLNDSLNILKIVTLNNLFYGISNRKYLVYSSDDGKNWSYKDFGDSFELLNIFEKDGYLYLISKNKIFMLNEELHIEREYNFTLDTSYYSFEIISNKIVFSQGKGKIGYINIDNEESGTISLSELGICSNCSVPKSIFSNKDDILYFFLNNELYQINLNDNKAELVYKSFDLKSSVFCAYGQDVFQIYNITNKEKNLDSLYFIKLNKDNKTPIHVKLSGNDRYVSNMIFTHLQFISQDTIIAVGQGKLIYMSYDGGRYWELKSLLNQFSYLFLNNSQNAFILAPFAQCFHTNNGGATWLTQKSYFDVFYKNPSYKLPLHYNTLRYCKEQKILYIVTSDYDTSKRFIYSVDGGETIDFKNHRLQNWVPSSSVYPLILSCFDKILIFTHRQIKPKPMILYIDRLNDDLNIERSDTLQEKVFEAVYNLNDTLVAIGKEYYDTLNPNSNKYNVYISTDTAVSWNIHFSFEVDKNVNYHHFYTSSQIKNLIFLNWAFTKFLEDDTLYYSKIYMIDIHNKTFNELIQQDSEFKKVFYINHRYNFFKLVYDEIKEDYFPIFHFVENIDKYPFIWRIYKDYRFSPPLINITEDYRLPFTSFLSDTMFAFVAYDSLFKEEALFFARPKIPTSIMENFQLESTVSIYISNPIPTPAHSFTKVKIYWDYWLDADQANFSVVNLLGMEVSRKEDFLFTRFNSYSGELIWYPKDLSPGVYILSVRIGNHTASTLVVLN